MDIINGDLEEASAALLQEMEAEWEKDVILKITHDLAVNVVMFPLLQWWKRPCTRVGLGSPLTG